MIIKLNEMSANKSKFIKFMTLSNSIQIELPLNFHQSQKLKTGNNCVQLVSLLSMFGNDFCHYVFIL